MDENPLQKLREALQSLSTLLDNAAIRTAVGQIPASLKTPVINGLKQVLSTIKDALNELKSRLDSVVSLGELFTTINDLLSAAEGLAPGQKSTLEDVRNIVSTLQSLPGPQDILDTLALVDAIVAKLEGM